ncbi:MAG: hypothetical protein H7144_11380 [Burkholderiales bacterium]|nr:hypothetical protein [Phycisphaerae bacterium]
MPNQLQLPLSFLVGASVVFYIGTHVLWRGFGAHRPVYALSRGALLGLPIVLIALWLTLQSHAGLGVSVLMTASVVMVTLVLGVSAMSAPDDDGLASPSLRLLVPIAAAVFIAGMSGELRLSHALLIGVVTSAMLLSRPRDEVVTGTRRVGSGHIWLGVICLIAGAIILSQAVDALVKLPIVPLVAPVIVPLTILAAVGLLVGDVHARSNAAVIDTVVGCVIGLLGVGLPLVILTGTLAAPLYADLDRSYAVLELAPGLATTAPTAPPTSAPAGVPEAPLITMPLATWRIDAVLLVVLAGLLFPAGMGKASLGRVEGMFLVLVCVFFMIVTVLTVRG